MQLLGMILVRPLRKMKSRISEYFGKRKEPPPPQPPVLSAEERAAKDKASAEHIEQLRLKRQLHANLDALVLSLGSDWGLSFIPNPPNGKPPKEVRLLYSLVPILSYSYNHVCFAFLKNFLSGGGDLSTLPCSTAPPMPTGAGNCEAFNTNKHSFGVSEAQVVMLQKENFSKTQSWNLGSNSIHNP